jgi:hypothetical protein
MRKIIIQAVVLIAVIAGASITATYFSEASINYSLDIYRYQKIDDKWFTILNDTSPRSDGTISNVHLENKGMFDGTFRLIIKLTNASFYNASFPVIQQANEYKASIPVTLKAHQQIDETFYFNVTGKPFIISIDLQADQLFLRSTERNWGQQNTFYYGQMDNITWIPSVFA